MLPKRAYTVENWKNQTHLQHRHVPELCPLQAVAHRVVPRIVQVQLGALHRRDREAQVVSGAWCIADSEQRSQGQTPR